MKRLAEHVLSPLESSGLLRALENLEGDRQRLRVLTYHRVAEPDEDPLLEPGLISATPAGFRDEMALLAERYNPISLEQLVQVQEGRARLPRRAVLVTFDDGYRDFADHAWPVMKQIGVPAVLFVPTAFPDAAGRGFWWDRLYAALLTAPADHLTLEPFGRLELGDARQRRDQYRRLRGQVKSMPHPEAMRWVDAVVTSLGGEPGVGRVLSWERLRELAADGVSVCSHSRDHALLTRLTPAELESDLIESLNRIRDEIGSRALPVLAYPSNASNQAVRDAVKAAGYRIAFGGRRRFNTLPVRDPLQINRVPVQRYGRGLFSAQLRPSVCELGAAVMAARQMLRA